MILDLKSIIDAPGKSLSFDYYPETDGLEPDGVISFAQPLHAVGRVRNSASVLYLEANVTAVLNCECARCLAPVQVTVDEPFNVVLTDREEDADDVDIVPLQGDSIELDELMISAFILGLDPVVLCKEDCKGLCPSCGKNLNDGACGCGPEPDPRLALLRQLLEKE